jgi:hypothetical protein
MTFFYLAGGAARPPARVPASGATTELGPPAPRLAGAARGLANGWSSGEPRPAAANARARPRRSSSAGRKAARMPPPQVGRVSHLRLSAHC